MSGEFSRTVLVLCCLFSLVLMPAGRWLTKSLLVRWGLWVQPVLVLGAGKTGVWSPRALLHDRYLGYKIQGFLDDDPVKKKSGPAVGGVCFPVLGGFAIASRSWRILVSVADCSRPRHGLRQTGEPGQLPAAHRCVGAGGARPVRPAGRRSEGRLLFRRAGAHLQAGQQLGQPSQQDRQALLRFRPGTDHLICLSPLLAVVAAAIKLIRPAVAIRPPPDWPNGRHFDCYKFRSMAANAQEMLITIAARTTRNCSRNGSITTRSRTTPASLGSASSCAAPAWTSCLSC